MSKLTPADINSIRQLLTNKKSPTEKEITAILGRSISGIKSTVTKFKSSFIDLSISCEALANTINNFRQNIPIIPPQNIDSKPTLPISGLPPKMMSKVMAHAPKSVQQEPRLSLKQNRSLSVDLSTKMLTLSRTPDNPLAILHSHEHMTDPEIGTLAVLVYKIFPTALVCRILSYKIENNEKYYLISFFQKGFPPCFVLSDYLFQLKPSIFYALGHEEEWNKYVEENDITADWLLEHIYSATQNIVFSCANILFSPDVVSQSVCKPTPDMNVKILVQVRTFAALLFVCYIAGKWEIPPEKLTIVIDTIMKINTSSYASTQNIVDNIDSLIRSLLSLPEKQKK